MSHYTSSENWTVVNFRKLWLDAYHECFPDSLIFFFFLYENYFLFIYASQRFMNWFVVLAPQYKNQSSGNLMKAFFHIVMEFEIQSPGLNHPAQNAYNKTLWNSMYTLRVYTLYYLSKLAKIVHHCGFMLMKHPLNQCNYTAIKSEQQGPGEAHPVYFLSVKYDFSSFIPSLWNISDNVVLYNK